MSVTLLAALTLASGLCGASLAVWCIVAVLRRAEAFGLAAGAAGFFALAAIWAGLYLIVDVLVPLMRR